jgi:hypothetical protein
MWFVVSMEEESMPKIIVNAFLTLDGVMQAPGGPDAVDDARQELESLRKSRALAAGMRLQLREAASILADGAYVLSPLPGHRIYTRRAA